MCPDLPVLQQRTTGPGERLRLRPALGIPKARVVRITARLPGHHRYHLFLELRDDP